MTGQILNFSESTEMYLKALIELSASQPATVSRLADKLGVTQVSANEMVHRLIDQGLMTHQPYRSVNLTKKGLQIGSNVMRRQRLWECFLHAHLKVEWARLYELTCSLEHATPPEVTEALADYLSQPSHCPHGNPIPDVNGEFIPVEGVQLSALAGGESARVVAVQETGFELLQYLNQHSLVPGCEFTLVERAPLQGPLILRIGVTDVALGLQAAQLVTVERL